MEILTRPSPGPETGRQTDRDAVIHWNQLLSLAALYASVIIGWIAYQNYQPRLLVQFGFQDFSFLLTAAQGVILVLTPLAAGRLGDRYRIERGHRLPVITAGISFAAMIFMAVAFTLLTGPGDVFRWVLPALIVLWLVAMSLFTSPALSMMELFTPVDRLPHAMAIMTITSNLLYSLEPVIVDIIDYLGAPVTFMCGGIAVFLSGYALKKNSLGLFRRTGNGEARLPESDNARSPYGSVLLPGIAFGAASTMLFYVFPRLIPVNFYSNIDAEGKMVVVSVLVLSAVLSWPMSHVVNRFGMSRVFWAGIIALALSTATMYYFSSTVVMFILAVLFSVSFTAVSVASLPLAISRAAYTEKVFCVGIFFSGAALPEAVFEAWASLP